MMFSPILLFAFKRPEHLKLTIDALKGNIGAANHPLFIYIDGPKTPMDIEAVEAVQALADAITGFKSVSCIKSSENKGLANSIINGVSNTLKKHGSVIVLEDDMITSPFFLQYMREALAAYKDNTRVYCVHGYNYPADFHAVEGDSFFKRGADCWGWATWAKAWQSFEPDAGKLLAELRARNLTREFDYNGAYPFTTMLKRQANGEIDSWAIRWNASVFLQGGLTLNAKWSLVKNIGLDGSGVHCSETDGFYTEVSDTKLSVDGGPVEVNREAFTAISKYLKKQPGSRYSWQGLKKRLSAWFHTTA